MQRSHTPSMSKATTINFHFEPQSDWECISQGAEARIWKIPNYLPTTPISGETASTATTSALPCIAKERFSKAYRHPTLDAKLTKQRVKSEVKCIHRCRQRGVQCPAVYGVHGNALYLEYIHGTTVRQHLTSVIKEQNTNESIYASLASNMGELIAKTHNAGVVHGDLTTSNMMIMVDAATTDDNTICLIDFGLARITSSVEELGVDLYVLERALLSTHPELQERKFMDAVLDAYKVHAQKSNAVLQRLEQVRQRGRKRECFG